MRFLYVLLVGLVIGLVPASAGADVTITDWRGVSVVATEASVDSNGVKISYHTAGQGPLVVFVHSITGPWFDFRHQMVMLSERYQVVSMSTRGTDKSDKPKGVEAYATARISEDIIAIMNQLGAAKATIVGQDSGGLHAWHFAMTHPERTDRLISLGSIHPAGLIRELVSNPDQQKASTFQRGMQENPDAGKAFGDRIRNQPPSPGEPAEITRLRREAYERLDVDSIVGFYKANWPWSPVTMETKAFGFKYGEFPLVTAPVLFIYGKNSGPFQNATLNEMWKWVDAPLRVQVLPGVGHGPHTEVPELVTPMILEWLASGASVAKPSSPSVAAPR